MKDMNISFKRSSYTEAQAAKPANNTPLFANK